MKKVTLQELGAMTTPSIQWSSWQDGKTQFYDADLSLDRSHLILAGNQGAQGYGVELNLDGTSKQWTPLPVFRSTDVLTGPGRTGWFAAGHGASGSSSPSYSAHWSGLQDSTTKTLLKTTGVVYSIVEGFNFGGKILDVYNTYDSAEPGANANVTVRIDGEPFNTSPLPLVVHAAAFRPETKQVYVVGWRNNSNRNTFDIYSANLNDHYWSTGSASWSLETSLDSAIWGQSPTGSDWQEVSIETLIWDVDSSSLIYSGGAYEFTGDQPSAGFVGAYSQRTKRMRAPSSLWAMAVQASAPMPSPM